MKKIVAVFFIIGIFSCSKSGSNTSNSGCDNYVKGEVIAGIKNTTSIEDAFSLFNSLDLPIDEMNGFFYTSPYSKDSLANLISYLNTKSYINARGFTASGFIHYQTGIINLTNIFFDMNAVNQQDWINTEKTLNLVDTKGGTKNIVLKVPVGQEKYWLGRLKESHMITWTELNCIEQIQLF
jgi:hypothetical protein